MPASRFSLGVVVVLLGVSTTIAAQPPEESTGTISGRVLGPDLTPVGGVTIEAWETGAVHSSTVVAKGVSSTDGRYRLLGLSPGLVSLRGQHPDYFSAETIVVDARIGDTSAPDLHLVPAAHVSGRVVDQQGNPIVAELSAYPAETTSTSDGRFELTGLPPDLEADIWVRAPGYGPVRHRAAAGESEVVIALTKTLCQKGRVFIEGASTEGRIAVLNWSVEGEDTGPNGYAHPRLDAEGLFEICAAPGTYDVSVKIDGWARCHVGGVSFPSADDELVMVLRTGSPLSGRILNEERQAVPQAEVWVRSDDGPDGDYDRNHDVTTLHSDQAGQFHLKGLPDAPVVFDIRADGYISKQVTLEAPSPDVDFVLSRGGVLTGQVVRPDGTAVAGAQVVVSESERPLLNTDFSPQAITDSSGRFSVELVAPGLRYAQARTRDGAVSSVATVVVAEDGPSDITLIAGMNGSIHGRVVGVDATSLRRVVVKAWNHKGGDWVVTPGDDGAFHIPAVPEGEIAIQATLGDASFITSVEITREQPVARPELVLSQGPGLTGTVLRRGSPQEGLGVQVMSEAGMMLEVTTDENGRFAAPGVPSGRTHLLVNFGPHRHDFTSLTHPTDYREVVEIREAITDVVVDLPSAVMRGRVVSGATGSPVSGAAIDALSIVGSLDEGEPDGVASPAATTDEDGNFELHSLADGPTFVMVEAQGYATWFSDELTGPIPSQTVRLEPEEQVYLSIIDTRSNAPMRDPLLRISDEYFYPAHVMTELQNDRYRLRGIGQTPVDLYLSGGDIAPQTLYGITGPLEAEVLVSPGGLLEVLHSGTVTIELQDAEGRPVPFCLDRDMFSTALQHESPESPTLLAVRSGKTRVVVTSSDGATQEFEVTVQDGVTTTFDAR